MRFLAASLSGVVLAAVLVTVCPFLAVTFFDLDCEWSQ